MQQRTKYTCFPTSWSSHSGVEDRQMQMNWNNFQSISLISTMKERSERLDEICPRPRILLVAKEILCVCAYALSRVWLFATPGTVACQVPLSMAFSRQEYWSGFPCPPPADLPNPGIVSPVCVRNLRLLRLRHRLHWRAVSLRLAPPWEACQGSLRGP